MAPGCFSTAATAKDSQELTPSSGQIETTTMKPVEIVAENNIVIENEDIESDSNESILIISKEKMQSTLSSILESDECITTEIDLDSIPLPLSPPPPPQLEEQDDEDEDSDDDEDEEEDEEDDDDDDEEDNDEGKNLVKNTPRLLVPRQRCANRIFDTVDAFEILEQTIIKQKRVAKLKNTDLRRKVLLKRTFDLVCEIMDRENGFNDDTEDVEPVVKPARVIKAIPIPSKPENEPTTDEVVASSDALELELHDHSKMDESDEDEELDDEEESMKAATTLVKLVDLGQEQSAQVPRQTKRRSSSDEDEESYDYEYGMVHLNDQQLNYKTSIDHHPLDHESDLNIYSDGADRFHVKQQQPDQSASTRSNHPRKKLKI